MCNKKIYSKTAECDVDFNLSTTEIAYHKETKTMHDVY